ncbi:Acetyl-coenzyme A transporter 1 [Nymphon striatum]|nr:Acetyl-coenzyme A transporter 1 [Nymphon striatum]
MFGVTFTAAFMNNNHIWYVISLIVVYSERFGRRKSWIIPTQYAMALFMLVLSLTVTNLIGKDGNDVPNVAMLTLIFFMLKFFSATQDIALDAWTISILSKRYVGYSVFCEAIGDIIGKKLGTIVFFALESPHFCNTFLRSVPSEHGIVNFEGYLFFWGVFLTISTTLLLALNMDEQSIGKSIKRLNVRETYQALKKIAKLESVQLYMSIGFTIQIGFAATDVLTNLKLIEGGLGKETLQFILFPVVFVNLILPLFSSQALVGDNSLSTLRYAVLIKVILGIVIASFIWVIYPSLSSDSASMSIFVVIFVLLLFNQESNQEICQTSIDGYYVTATICFILGLIWVYKMSDKVKQLHLLPKSSWLCDFTTKTE